MVSKNTNIKESVAESLEPFSEELNVLPYRIHFTYAEVCAMAKHFKLEPSDLNELATRMVDWSMQEGGVDGEGLYRLSKCNPDGRWDWYEIGGRWGGYIPYSRQNAIKANTLAKSAYLKNCLPYYVLTPNGEWFERERFYFVEGVKKIKRERMKNKKWLETVRGTLLRWPNHTVVCVDIHC